MGSRVEIIDPAASSTYLYSTYQAITASTATAYKWSMKTPNTATTFECKIRCAAPDGFHVELLEASTISAAGSTQTVYNLDRNSANTCNVEFQANNTFSADGTRLQIEYSAAQNNGMIELPGPNEYFKLKQNERFQIRIIAASNTSVALNVFLREPQ